MLKRANKIGKKDFPDVMKSSRSKASNLFIFRSSPKSAPDILNRFSVVVSKKVAKNATDRNLIRRRFYNAIREIIKENDKFKGSAIFITKSNAFGASFSEIKNDIAKLLGN